MNIAREHAAVVDGALPAATAEPRRTQPQAIPDDSGVGDSRSDDPSDDEPDPGGDGA